jgi:tRNA nucleotidyltransferase/poly(A) polymerase
MRKLELPEPLREPLDRLESAGSETWLVGCCVRGLVAGDGTRDFECVSLADPRQVLDALPSAVVTAPSGGRATLPTAAGPLDIVAVGATPIEQVLLHRDFTLHAMAYRPHTEVLCDPHGGLRDLRDGRLAAPGVAKERLAEDPLRALRALRLVSQHGFEPDAELLAALPEQAAALHRIGGRRVRVEIEALLLGDHAERALTLLRSSSLEGALAAGVRDDAAHVVARLPPDLELRFAAWLRGARVRAALRNLRCPRDRSLRIERLLQLHPVDVGSSATREARARRLLRRDRRQRERLLALRRAEVEVLDDPEARRSLARFARILEAMDRAQRVAEQRARLCIGGREVMDALGCGPGAKVGAALRFLSEQVSEDPTRNDPATLRRLLREWDTPTG